MSKFKTVEKIGNREVFEDTSINSNIRFYQRPNLFPLIFILYKLHGTSNIERC